MTVYNTSHTPPLSSPGVTSSNGNPPANYNRPFSVSTYVHSSQNNPLSPNGSTYGHGTGSGAPSNYVPPPSSHATTPPLPEGGGANYYANTPIPHLGGGSSTAGTNQPSSYTPSSPPTTVYSDAALVPSGNPNSQPVWASPTATSSQLGANENAMGLYGDETLAPPRGVMSPPPPFSPGPEGRGGANNSTNAGYTPWAIPPEATEQSHYAYDTSLLGDPSQTSSSAIPAGRVIPSNAPTDRKARPTVGR
ncbi:hypothetical protein CPB86DRAFT_790302 [Serendipita vermifera]|nr:hypothetical protein CPB86DRAFT_790302 [Serendipita vermifera]